MKYKVGDEILVKGTIREIYDSVYSISYPDHTTGGHDENCLINLEEIRGNYVDKAYNKGLEDAWELLRSAYDMKPFEVAVTFGNSVDTFYDVIRLTPQEALAKLEAYEAEKEIKVGDVVEITHYGEKFKGVVLDILDEISFVLFTENGMVESYIDERVRKTGKHIDISSILAELRKE